jgi:hypothetical protein
METANQRSERHREGAPMNHNAPFRLRRTIVHGLVVATAIVPGSAIAASTGQLGPPGATLEPVAASASQFGLPPGATPEPVAASASQFGLPPGATPEPIAASASQFGLPPGATPEPVAASPSQPVLPPGATVEPVAAATGQPGGVQVAPVSSGPVVEVGDGLDWADAGIGAGIAFGGILLLGGALLVARRSAQRHRLATH